MINILNNTINRITLSNIMLIPFINGGYKTLIIIIKSYTK